MWIVLHLSSLSCVGGVCGAHESLAAGIVRNFG